MEVLDGLISAASHFGLVYVEVDNERERGGGERRARCWQANFGSVSQVSAVRRVGRTSAVAVSLPSPDIAASVIVCVCGSDVVCVHCTDGRAIAILR